jgi:ubiquinone/menaquinone biosynthesis C-methylase UbiE
MKDKVIQAYNKLAVSYEHEVDLNNVYNTEYERPAMIDLLPDRLTGLKILDAGCAAGWYTEHFINHGAIPTAIDISPEMVEATKRRTKGKVEILCSDLSEKLPFEDDTYDIILSSLTLHYLESWENTFFEFSRVLKANGTLLFSVHHPFTDIHMSQTKEYFKTELLIDHWKRSGEMVEVVFFRRPLHKIVNVTSNFFNINELIEPLPTEGFKKKRQDSYERLMKQPNFLIIKAVNSKK